MNHPTWVELDALYLGDVNEQASHHVGQCTQCADYLASLSAPTLNAQSILPRIQLGTRTPRRSFVGPTFAALAAALVVFSVWPRAEQTRPKSTPAISVYTRQKERIELWDGKATFQNGDAIRFEIFSSEMKSVAVLSWPPGQDPQLLYQGQLSADATTLLPLSFSFDEAPEPENVVVVLSAQSLDLSKLQNAARQERRDSAVWVTRFQFPKTTKVRQ